jgi:membrane protein
VVGFLTDAWRLWKIHRLPLQAAGLAFYLALSLGPLLIILTDIAGLFVNPQSAEADILSPLRPLLGGHAVGAIRGLAITFSHHSSSVLPSTASVIILFLGAAGIFEQLKETLDAIWQVPVSRSGLLGVVRNKFLSVLTVASAILLILILLTSTTLIAGLTSDMTATEPALARSLSVLNLAVSFAVITVLFGVTLKLLPDAMVRWKDVWFGATCTSVMFIAGQFLIGFFLARSGLESTFGRATAMVVILLWLYYSAQIYLFGAVLTRAFAMRARVGGGE